MKIDFKNLFKAAKQVASDHLPEILTGIGLVGMVTSTVFAVKATPTAMERIEDKKEELGVEKLDILETVKTAGPCFVPSAIIGVAGGACVVAGAVAGAKKSAKWATLYTVSDATAQGLQKKIVEMSGEEKAEEINKEVRKEAVEKSASKEAYDSLPSGILDPGGGSVLCKDIYSGRLFWGSEAMWRNAVAKLNNGLSRSGEPYMSMNEFYDYVGKYGLEHTESGETLGWNSDWGLVEPWFDSGKTSEGVPYLICGFNRYSLPKHGFHGFR